MATRTNFYLGRITMREFMLGFFVASSLMLAAYIVWENKRHVPVVIKEVPVPVQMMPQNMGPYTDNPDIETWDT